MPKKILIIEDRSTMFAGLKDTLEKEGHHVLLAETGEDGVKRTKDDNPDLVIIDTLLPGIDGFEACRRIKNAVNRTSPKVIIATGDIDEVDVEKALEAGASDFCAKTSDSSHLITAVKGLIGGE